MTLTDLLGLFEQTQCTPKLNTLEATSLEMLTLYQEQYPFSTLATIDGECILWEDDFIQKCLLAMSTGSLSGFSDVEKQIWYQFVNFEDSMSNSANASIIGAIGCTVPDVNGNSYVVTTSGTTSILCELPQTSVAKLNQSQSLEQYFMDLYNCEVPNDCGIITGTVTDIAPCPV